MRDWFISMLDPNIYGLEITLFSLWHIGYLLMVIGVPVALTFLLKNKSQKVKKAIINAYLITATASYALDFFIMPLSTGSIDIDKLPFHICTLLSILACFGRFNPHFKWLKKPTVILCICAPLMYCCYPGTALGGISPLSYKVTQTFFYHGCLFAYGLLSLTWEEVVLDIKKCWQELLVIVGIAMWASVGNYFFNAPGGHHYDWFFLTGSTFPFIPTWLMPFAVVAAIFGMVMITYGLFYLVRRLANKPAKGEAVTTDAVADEQPAAEAAATDATDGSNGDDA